MKRLAVILFVLAAAAPALAQDASGAWQLTVTPPDGSPRTTAMKLKKSGDNLSGTLLGPQDVEIAVAGTQTGADVALTFSVPTQQGPIAVTLKGRQDGESMKGTASIGSDGKGDWTAARGVAPAAAPAASPSEDLTGTWALQTTSPNGPGSPTATIKQEGEKLTGRYTGRFGEAPLTGTVKDKAFSFQVTFTAEGTAVTVTYTGRVNPDGISGKVSFGDYGEGTFTGKKQ